MLFNKKQQPGIDHFRSIVIALHNITKEVLVQKEYPKMNETVSISIL